MSEEADLRSAVDDLMSRPPPPARGFALLDRGWLPALSWGALHHPNSRTRWLCLDYLDHVAVPASAAVFIAALDDPVPRVRRHAIHALTCRACKSGPWPSDVITPLRRVVAADVNPRVRFEALRALLLCLDAAAAQQTRRRDGARRHRCCSSGIAPASPRSSRRPSIMGAPGSSQVGTTEPPEETASGHGHLLSHQLAPESSPLEYRSAADASDRWVLTSQVRLRLGAPR